MSLTVRPATAGDLPSLVDLLSRQMTEHQLPSSSEAVAQAAATVLGDPRLGSFLVAVVAGEVVGVAYVAFLQSMEHAATIPLLEELFVVPEHRGNGAGSALLRSAIEQFSTAPGLPMELEVDASHRGVESFYHRHGFTLRQRSRWIHWPRAKAASPVGDEGMTHGPHSKRTSQ